MDDWSVQQMNAVSPSEGSLHIPFPFSGCEGGRDNPPSCRGHMALPVVIPEMHLRNQYLLTSVDSDPDAE